MDTIILEDKVIKYKEHIRKIVEALTIHESDKWGEYQSGMKIIARNPTIKVVTPFFMKAVTVAFFAGVVAAIYSFLI
jgi:hypothetical protein